MNEFILASSNAHKAQELEKLLAPAHFKIIAAPEKLEVAETGSTYVENAFIKAQAYFAKFKRPCVADDSGLNVEALPDQLGVFSARFGGPGLDDQGRCQLLLEKLKDLQTPEQRRASFSCYLCFYLSDQEIFFFEGRVQGFIGHELRGSDGFGYDPLFIPLNYDGKSTLAEIQDWKNEHSHRAVAAREALSFFKDRNCQKV